MTGALDRRRVLWLASGAAMLGVAPRSAFALQAAEASGVAAPLTLSTEALRLPRRGRRPLWTPTDAAALDAALAAADRHGIDASQVRGRIATASAAARDQALTRAALAYARALSEGLADPAKVFPIYTIPRNRYDVQGGLLRALHAGALETWFDGLAPSDGDYRTLSAAYLDARRQSGTPRPAQIPAGPTIRAGDADPRIPQIAARLGVPPSALDGSLITAPAGPDAGGAPQPPDASPTSLAPPPSAVPVLGPALVEAVKAYRRANGLREDGSIGPDTLGALNAGPDDRARTLALNLERRRWLVREPAPRRIDVNIPAQMLVYFEDGAPVWTTRVAVGRTDDQTPDIQARFSTLTVNPPWHVPASIIRAEIRGKGPGYLESHHMRWTRAGLVQEPGPWASLGLVKFDLQDPYDIYLHDTPVKGVFDDSARDLSHGCVRVEDAVPFARRLADEDGETGRFDEALASGRTEPVTLRSAIPVRLLYHTAFVDGAGRVTYREDIYGRDALLARALGMPPLASA